MRSVMGLAALLVNTPLDEAFTAEIIVRTHRTLEPRGNDEVVVVTPVTRGLVRHRIKAIVHLQFGNNSGGCVACVCKESSRIGP